MPRAKYATHYGRIPDSQEEILSTFIPTYDCWQLWARSDMPLTTAGFLIAKKRFFQSLSPHMIAGSSGRDLKYAEEILKRFQMAEKITAKSKAFKKGPGKMDAMQRARHLAYEPPSKSVAASIAATQTRLREHVLKSVGQTLQQAADPEQEKQAKVVGQLKAAEARNRIRLMRFRFQCMRAQELNNLISCQPTARDAIRLEVFLPPRPHKEGSQDRLRGLERERVESLLMDDKGLLTNRIP
ncbi:protein LKAAEAR1 isoform X2 [Hyperolius riggenbachi]|uniref:protein LKAAEAR1 isoform X2 n=1 Tax=Hyperolius riggenbachi TaxID=752182 RepID=UPI0035A2A94C